MTSLDTLAAPHPVRLSSKDFRLLAESGAFAEYARAELIEGEIIVVNAQFRRHAMARRRLVRSFEDALLGRGDGLAVIDECSVAFDDGSMPQPDIVITSEPEGDGPIPLGSVHLLVEIADTTLADDLGRKQRLYAEYAVPEYWVIDLVGRRVVRMWSPDGDAYAGGDRLAFGDPAPAVTIDGLAVATSGLE